MAEPSMRHVSAPQRMLDDDRLRSTRGELGPECAEDRPEDGDPAADEIPENDPPIERSDGQVYGG